MRLKEYKAYIEEIEELSHDEVYQQLEKENRYADNLFRSVIASAMETAVHRARLIDYSIENEPLYFAQAVKREENALALDIEMCEEQLKKLAKVLKQDNFSYPDSLSKEKVEEFKQKVSRIADSFAANKESVREELSSNGPDTMGDFDVYLKELKDAKTFFNSNEYTGLIEAVQYINTKEKFEIEPNMDDEHTYATKLWAIKKQINIYLDHKAADGVKQNSFKKLAAVEKLNKEITRRLQKLDICETPEFPFDRYCVNVQEVAQADQKDVQTYLKNHDEKTMPTAISDDELTKKYEEAVKHGFKVTKDEMKNADECMRKIVLKACNLGVSNRKVNDLRGMKEKFADSPANEIAPKKEAPKKEAPKKEVPQKAVEPIKMA